MFLYRRWVCHSALRLILVYHRLPIATRLTGLRLLFLLHDITQRAAAHGQAVCAAIALEVVLPTHVTSIDPERDPSKTTAECPTEQETLYKFPNIVSHQFCV